jgi:hypothetical protein
MLHACVHLIHQPVPATGSESLLGQAAARENSHCACIMIVGASGTTAVREIALNK